MTTCSCKLLEEKVIYSGGWYPNALFDSKGNIIVGIRKKPESLTIYSKDGGTTWEQAATHVMDISSCHILSDGTVLVFKPQNVIQDKVRLEQEQKPFIGWIRRAKSLEDLIDGIYVDDFVKMSIPDLSGTHGDSENYCLGGIDHGVVELPNGDLVITLYGRFRQDVIKVPYYPEGAYQYRSWTCISKDRGNSWNYLQTLGANEIALLPERSEGYCEPDMIVLHDNTLLSVMRTGGSSYKGSPERYTHLCTVQSENGGATWSLPVPIYPYGVWPRLLKMSNGVIVCASGRPGVFLLFSTDGGKTWSKPEIVTDFDDDWNRCSSGYNSIGESSPGVLTLLYDDVDRNDENREHFTKMRKYRIEI